MQLLARDRTLVESIQKTSDRSLKRFIARALLLSISIQTSEPSPVTIWYSCSRGQYVLNHAPRNQARNAGICTWSQSVTPHAVPPSEP